MEDIVVFELDDEVVVGVSGSEVMEGDVGAWDVGGFGIDCGCGGDFFILGIAFLCA